ncbi:MAG: DUF309 domain-containing protein [Cyanobacteriota bacterium]
MVQASEDLLISDPRWTMAVDLFNQRAWYQAHDAFEELWQETIGPDRPLLQALVQIAVAHVHLERDNQRGATVLLGEALGRLVPCDNEALGLDLKALRTCISNRLRMLQQGDDPTDLPVPKLISL